VQAQFSLLQGYLATAWRNRWYGVGCAWVICICGWVAVSLLPNIYQSSARLYVDVDAVLTPLLQGLALENTAASQLEVMQRTLLSRPNLEMVISRTPLDLRVRDPAQREEMVTNLGTSIKLEPQTKNLFTITYRNTDPKLAYAVVQAIMNIFIESRSGTNRADMDNARAFIQQQITNYEQKLRTAEQTRADFRAKYLDLLPADSGISHLDAARTAAATLAGQLADAQAKRSMLQHELAITPPTLVTESDSGTPGGNSELAAAQEKLRDLLTSETENHPDVQQQRQRIAALKAGGGGRSGGTGAHTSSLPSPVYSQLKIELVDTDASLSSLQRQSAAAIADRDRLEAIARGAPGIEAQYLNLDRDYDTLRSNYTELLARRESMRLSAAADEEADKIKLRIVDPAQVSQNPVSPPRALLLMTVLVAGLAGGVVLAVGLAQLDRSFHSVVDLEAMGLPVIGGVSLIPAMVGKVRNQLAENMGLAAALLLLCMICGGLVYHTILLGASA
jgi:polysaccharide chain length determinant protein (PEP-CTERM system associated)